MWEAWLDPWVRQIPWRRAWQHTPVFLPGESHGQRSLVGSSPWGCKELDTTEQLTLTFNLIELNGFTLTAPSIHLEHPSDRPLVYRILKFKDICMASKAIYDLTALFYSGRSFYSFRNVCIPLSQLLSFFLQLAFYSPPLKKEFIETVQTSWSFASFMSIAKQVTMPSIQVQPGTHLENRGKLAKSNISHHMYIHLQSGTPVALYVQPGYENS